MGRFTCVHAADQMRGGTLPDLVRQDDFPPSLKNYMQSCHKLALDRAQSDVPLLSHPLSSLAKRRAATSSAAPLPPKSTKGTKRPANKSGAGLGPKKAHEVEQFCRLVQTMQADDATPPTHVIDVGSGRVRRKSFLSNIGFNAHHVGTPLPKTRGCAPWLARPGARLVRVAAGRR